jgi:predicted membrane metal-binding protein
MADRAIAEPASASDPSKIMAPTTWLVMVMTAATILLLASLHLLSPEFAPSWRLGSECAWVAMAGCCR